MSTVKIALQPPPNVDFVVGYPGIPPGAKDRPQAAVKGAVEVRVGPPGAKAKWVRVELKKIETLPGGGQANSYFDHVGPSPISLWQSSEDYSLLQSQDFPFLIRVPESMPPSIALERGAGIRYELVATVCTLGKKGFFRRRQTSVISQATNIIIDKHELHSTWPVYSQPESRSVSQDGLQLTVERGRTCYGPGDRVSIMAILKSESIQPAQVRGFELTLKETIIFRAGPQATAAKRSGPQVKTATIGEQKVPLNVALYRDGQHKAELGCLIPNTHTTTTLVAARHIDITYVIVVRAWIGAMESYNDGVTCYCVELAEERIGRSYQTHRNRTQSLRDSQHHNSSNHLSGVIDLGVNSRAPLVPPKQSVQYSTAPVGQNGSANAQKDQIEVDELGALEYSHAKAAGTINHPGYGSSNRPASRGLQGIQEDSGAVGGGGPSTIEPRPSFTSSGRRRRVSAATAQNRFTITNISEKDTAEGIQAQVPRATPPTTPARGDRSWPTAENEKKQLYENAVARVQMVQGSAAMGNATSEALSDASTTTTPKKSKRWPTAEEEKVRLYDKAQATAKRTQAYGAYSPSIHSRSSSEANSPPPREKQFSSGSAAPSTAISAGAALYQQAVSSMARPSNSNLGNSSHVSPSPPPSGSGSSPRNVPHYPSAEEEKAALTRYYQAKLAVDRSQNTQYASREGIVGSSSSSAAAAAPIPYDSLYGGSSQGDSSDMPPPFDSSGSSSQPHYLNEKERLRRQYEAQDAAALAAQAQVQEPLEELHSSPAYTSPPPAESGLSEKELLRRRYEEQDAAALAQQQQGQALQAPQPPPPRANGSRAPPVPPPVANGFKPLTAAEEKAQLRAKYEAEDGGAGSGLTNGSGFAFQAHSHPYANATAIPNGSSNTTPPPLLPRPPAEYIQETQVEDMRGRFYNTLSVDSDDTPTPLLSNPRLDIRPFTPFDIGFGQDGHRSSAGHTRLPPPPPPAM
ncbi:hypothetical protein BU15DRAFT_73000 [Melanogaster broomeanus]|nr:hypothetical protein BU15DRAFT_73000 [Melanogaster broomeanus]